MRSVRISAKSVRFILSALEMSPASFAMTQEIGELRKALAPRPVSSARRKTKTKRETRRATFADVRKAVEKRAGLACECGCGRWFRGVGGAAQVDHFFGRSRDESVASCWRLRADCHERKTLNRPDAAWWLLAFIAHCDRHGYAAEAAKASARLDFVHARKGAVHE